MPTKRVELVDALRGYALFGLLLVHCYERFEVYWLDPNPDIWVQTVAGAFGGKAYAIFALLFGFSFATIMGNERERGGDFSFRFAWRLVLLALIGLAHQVFYLGDILQVLALVGLLLIPADRIGSNRVLLVIAAIAFLQLPLWLQAYAAGEGVQWALSMPYFWLDPSRAVLVEGSFIDVVIANFQHGIANKWSFYWGTGRIAQIIGLFLIGMVLQRSRLFADAGQRLRIWVVTLLVSAMIWIVVNEVQPLLDLPWPQDNSSPMQAMAITWAIQQWSQLAAMAFQVATFVLLWQLGADKVLRLFAPPGRMTLTLYVGQSLVLVPLFYGYGAGLYDSWSNAHVVWLGIAFFAIQIAFAVLWFRVFRFGPLEWAWRAATRTTLKIPMRRQE